MTGYLAQLDAIPAEQRWAMARGWLFDKADARPFFAELRADRPVLILPEVTLVTRWADCMTVLRRHNTFGVDLYKPKQGDYFMAQDDTAAHWREKSLMKAILDREKIPEMREWIGERTRDILAAAPGEIEIVRQVSRGVPVHLVEEWFGFRGGDHDDMIQWSYWNQQDAFWNQPFDAPFIDDPERIVRKRKKAIFMMFLYLARLTAGRSVAVKIGGAGHDDGDPVSRLIRMTFADMFRFNLRDVISNVGGLLIGAVETTSHCVVNAVEYLLENPDLHAEARAAALRAEPEDFDGYIFEALRYRPAFPYYFRTVKRDTLLAAGTGHEETVHTGSTVLAVTYSAMFDPEGFAAPDSFDPQRDFSDSFTFGQGIHSCLGRHIAAVMVPEIARQILRLDGLSATAAPDYRSGRVPETWQLNWR
ncbi:MAG: cytochrome P450 [Pseudomonadota bacterium]